MQDWQLLRDYVDHHSEPAFAALVERHVNFVYSTCLREVGDPALAEDVTQVVFIILARKAKSLHKATLLNGWLFNTARYACKNALRKEWRRQQQEQKAAEEMMRDTEAANSSWADIEPLLHDGMAALAAPEREAVLLRFFENRSLRDTGAALGISEDAARMRITRAVEKLRRHFARHGFAVPVAVLAALLAENAVQAAPASCVAAASHLSSATAPAAGVSSARSAQPETSLNPHVASLSQDVLRGLLFRKIGLVAGIGALLLTGGGAVTYFAHSGPASLPGVTSKPNTKFPNAPIVKAVPTEPVAVSSQLPAPIVRAPLIMPAAKMPAMAPMASVKMRPPEQSFQGPRKALKSSVPEFAEMPTVNTAEALPLMEPTNPAPLPDTKRREVPGPLPEERPVMADAKDVPKALAAPASNPVATAPDTVPIVPKSIARKKKPNAQNQRPRREVTSGSNLRGRVLLVNDSNSSISIKMPGAVTKTLTVPTDAEVFLDKSAAALEDIRAGMIAEVRLDDKQMVSAIYAREPLRPGAGQAKLQRRKEKTKTTPKRRTSQP